MNVLSLFDGISGAQVSLNHLNIKYDKYYASEIDANSIKVTQCNFPNTTQLGNINNWKEWNINWSEIGLICAGFCCQSFSHAGQKKGFKDERGQLFFIFNNILEHCRNLNPNLKFLAENVLMKEEFKQVIDDEIGTAGFELDSSRFCPQTRKRLYWTNIEFNKILPDNQLVLGDILQSNGEFDWYDTKFDFYGEDKVVCCKLHINGHDFLKRVNSKNHKCQTLTAVCGGNQQKKVYIDGRVRKLTPIEYERLMGFPDEFTKGISKGARYKALGNSWEINTVSHILKGLI